MAEQTRDQQRAELHKAIWDIANKLRGSVDGWDFKQYVLTTLFYRYISEEFAHYIDEGEAAAGDVGFSYAALTDEEAEMSAEERDEDRDEMVDGDPCRDRRPHFVPVLRKVLDVDVRRHCR